MEKEDVSRESLIDFVALPLCSVHSQLEAIEKEYGEFAEDDSLVHNAETLLQVAHDQIRAVINALYAKFGEIDVLFSGGARVVGIRHVEGIEVESKEAEKDAPESRSWTMTTLDLLRIAKEKTKEELGDDDRLPEILHLLEAVEAKIQRLDAKQKAAPKPEFQIPENMNEHFVLEHETHYQGRAAESERWRVILAGSAFITQWMPSAELALKEAANA